MSLCLPAATGWSLQVPNFAIAAPSLLLSLWACYSYAKANRKHTLTGGLLPATSRTLPSSSSSSSGSSSKSKQPQDERAKGSIKASNIPQNQQQQRKLKRTGSGSSSGDSSCSSGSDGVDKREGARQRRTSSPVPGMIYHYLRKPELSPLMEQHSEPITAGEKAGARGLVRGPGGLSGTGGSLRLRGPATAAAAAGGGGRQPTGVTPAAAGVAGPGQKDVETKQQQQQEGEVGLVGGFYSPDVVVFIIHMLVLSLVCLTTVHIQVSVRLLSSCMPWYWYAAHLQHLPHHHQQQQEEMVKLLSKADSQSSSSKKQFVGGYLTRGAWVWLYAFVMMSIGVVMFPNFYPWT